MKQDYPKLVPFIDEGLDWVELYFEKTESAYSMAIGEILVLQMSSVLVSLFKH